MPDPLIELALRVQLSGVPPAYGSWLLTPQPPLHEGEKPPVGQGGKENFRFIHQTCSIANPSTPSGHLNANPAKRRHNAAMQQFFPVGQGDWVWQRRLFRPRPFKCVFVFLSCLVGDVRWNWLVLVCWHWAGWMV